MDCDINQTIFHGLWDLQIRIQYINKKKKSLYACKYKNILIEKSL